MANNDNNVLSEKDIANIKESLERSIIHCDKCANEKQWPSVVRIAMSEAANGYRQTLEKVIYDVSRPMFNGKILNLKKYPS